MALRGRYRGANAPQNSRTYAEDSLAKMNREFVGAKQGANSERNWLNKEFVDSWVSVILRVAHWLRFVKRQPPVGCPRTASRDWRSPLALIFFVLPFAEPHAGATAVFVDEFHPSALEGAHDRRKGRGITRVAAGFNIGHRVAVDLSGLGEVAHAPI